MAKIGRKPNGIYYLDVHVPCDKSPNGMRRARVGLDTRDEDSAKDQRRLWMTGLHPKHPSQGGTVAPKGREVRSETSTGQKVRQAGTPLDRFLMRCLTEDDVWGLCKAKRSHESNVRVLTRLLPEGITLEELNDVHVKELDSLLKESGYASASRRKLLGSLSAACRFAEEEGLMTRPRFPSITVKNNQERVVSLDEEEALLDCIRLRREAEPLRAWWHFERLVVLLLDTGFRLGEAMQCGPSSVKRKRWFDHKGKMHEGVWLGLLRGTTKNDKPRDVPCTQRVLTILKELNERAANGRWFPWALGSSGPLYLLQNIRADMKARGFDFDDVKLHTFRHTCATRLCEGGMDLVSLRDWLGHSDIKITAGRYVHLMNGHIFRGASILDMYGPGSIGSDGGNEEDDGEDVSKSDHLTSGRDRATVATLGTC